MPTFKLTPEQEVAMAALQAHPTVGPMVRELVAQLVEQHIQELKTDDPWYSHELVLEWAALFLPKKAEQSFYRPPEPVAPKRQQRERESQSSKHCDAGYMNDMRFGTDNEPD